MTAPERLVAALADRYRIDRQLGEGGMATVYLAEDLKHHRQVAIKVLKPELAAILGAERFVHEIEMTAQLQHPHILPLHDSGEVNGTVFYVMPFVAGESLRDRLAREKPLSIADAVRIATEVASALDYAHRHGVIHRDIKPENILLHDGSALVADFGIALAAARSDGGTRMTETGMSLGTPHYMSPEQAMGERDLDARTDVYALGCVLYEMLTGEPPFSGPSAQAIIAKVVTERPTPPSATRDTVPEVVEDAVLTALSKLPVDRFASAAEFGAALAGQGTRTGPATRRMVATAPPGPYRRLSVALGVAALAALAALAAWGLLRRPASPGPSVYDVALPENAHVAFTGQNPFTPYGTPFRSLSVAPGGAFAVYLAREGATTVLWRRSLLDAGVTRLAGTEGALMPRVSPEGGRLAFVSGGELRVMALDGGSARRLGALSDPAFLEWAGGDKLLVVEQGGRQLRWFDPEGGEIESLPVSRCIQGQWLDAARLLCGAAGRAVIVDPATGEGAPILAEGATGTGSVVAGSEFRMVDDRYLVYASVDGELRAAPYDAATNLIGRSVTVLRDVRRESIGDTQFDLTANGGLVFAPGDNAEVGGLVRMGPDGVVSPLPIEPRPYHLFELSPDGHRLAAVVQGAGAEVLEVTDLRDGRTFAWLESEQVGSPYWNSTGDTIMVRTWTGGQQAVIRGSPFSANPPDTLIAGQGSPVALMDWPDDSTVLAYVGDDWSTVQFDPRATPLAFDTLVAGRIWSSRSPDRRHLLLWSADGRVFVTSNPPGHIQRLVASNAVEPLWIADRRVVYRSGDAWYVQDVDATGQPDGPRRLMGTDPRFADTFGWSNRPSRDGGIIYKQGPSVTSAGYLRVIPDWAGQMKKAVDEANR